jgi:hypothetical protein
MIWINQSIHPTGFISIRTMFHNEKSLFFIKISNNQKAFFKFQLYIDHILADSRNLFSGFELLESVSPIYLNGILMAS